ncbi:MAG: SRPBCC family protein [Chloroflexota bacterium]|nr:SRPBCC family protein [Chloroflexota bacterium]
MEADAAHRYEIYIRATLEEVWTALTDADQTPHFFMGLSVRSDWTPGSRVRQTRRDGVIWNEGVVLHAEPPVRLVTTFQARSEEARGDPPSRVTWSIERITEEVCRLMLVHDGLTADSATYAMVGSGWAVVLSSLKTWLETADSLPVSMGELFQNGAWIDETLALASDPLLRATDHLSVEVPRLATEAAEEGHRGLDGDSRPLPHGHRS